MDEITEHAPVVMLFATNVRCECALDAVTPVLNRIPEIIIWSIDFKDCDKVLRVVANTDVSEEIIMSLSISGFTCKVMQF